MLLVFIYHFSKAEQSAHDINSYIFFGGSAPSFLIAPSIFTSWVWPTTIVGAAEAGIIYGVSGGLAYALGAGIGFIMLIVLLHRFHTLMPDTPFITSFIEKRFSKNARSAYMFLTVLIALYLIIEMSAGIGFVLSGLFSVSFKLVTFLTVMVAIVFVVKAGIRGMLYNDFLNFFMITISLGVLVFIIIDKFSIHFIYDSLKDVALNRSNQNHNPSILNLATLGGTRYFIIATIVGIAQTIIDPSYAIRAKIAVTEKAFIKSFLLGGVFLFMPVAIISSTILGFTMLTSNPNISDYVNLSTLISSEIFIEQFPVLVSVLFAFLMYAVTMTTIISSLMGILGISTVNFYRESINSEGDERKKIIFGKTFTVSIGFMCALIGISLEKISLLTLDNFCGILFAAPCSVLIMGLLGKKDYGSSPLIALSLGLFCGFSFWFINMDVQTNWFYGTLISFFLPILILLLWGIIRNRKFNFTSLKW